MFIVKGGLAFKRYEGGGIIVLRNGKIIASLTQDDWILVVTHMAFENRELGEIHQMAEMLHTGEPGLKIDPPIAI